MPSSAFLVRKTPRWSGAQTKLINLPNEADGIFSYWLTVY